MLDHRKKLIALLISSTVITGSAWNIDWKKDSSLVSNCIGTIPTYPEPWNSITPYTGDQFVSYKDGIWQAKWWTTSTPGADNTWNYCADLYVGHVRIKVTGLSNVSTFPIQIGEKTYQISKNGGSIDLPSGSFDVLVNPIVEISSMHAYVASMSSDKLNITKKGDYDLDVSFVTQIVTQSKIPVTVNFPDVPPSSKPIVSVSSNNGYDDKTQSVSAGKNNINVPDYGEYTLQAASYKIDGKSYAANKVTVLDGTVPGSRVINYQYVSPRVLAGYLPVSWGNPIKISEAAEKGYNIVIPAFVILDGNNPVTFTDDHFLGYGGWNARASDPSIIAEINADISKAKIDYGLKYVLASVGGQNNTFKPVIDGDQSTMAKNVITFLKEYGFDGIDFDLEGIPEGYTAEHLATFIKELKKQDPAIIISSAPQVNNVGDGLGYVNTGTEQVYNVALKDGLFNYMFVQEYNTGGNYVDGNGDFCKKGSTNCHDETTAGFIPNSFQALVKITPKNTLIVPGEPATQSAAGAATVFNGYDKDTPYESMATAYSQLNCEEQFGGAMTWDIGLDSGNNYNFANSIGPIVLMYSAIPAH